MESRNGQQVQLKLSDSEQQELTRRRILYGRIKTRLDLYEKDVQSSQKATLENALEQMPLEKLQEIIDKLREHLEHSVHFINEQEEELASQRQTVAELGEKLGGTSEPERFSLEVELANEKERWEILGASLLGQRCNVRKLEAIYNQHWRVLRRRQGVFTQAGYADHIDLKSFLDPTEKLPGELPTNPEEEGKPPNQGLRWAIALSVVGLLAASAMTAYSLNLVRSQPAKVPEVAVPSETQARKAVAALGYLEPQGEMIKLSAPISSSTEGVRVEQLLVKRGDLVRAGQAIAVLDIRERLQAALEQAQKQVQIAQARLEQIRAGQKQGDIQAQDAKSQGTQAELVGQIIAQKATISGLEAQLQGESRAQEATIERIQAELQNAQANCHRYQLLYADGALSVQERDRICLQQTTTGESLKEAQAHLTRIVKTLQDRISEAQANLERTVTTLNKQLKAEKSTLKAMSEVRPVDVQVAFAELEGARAAFKRARAELNLAYVRAPRNGQILQIHTWPGEVVSDRGIVDLGQTDRMYVRAEVYETDINQVRTGQRAAIRSDAVIGTLQGIVDEIGLKVDKQKVLGTDPAADTDARVVEVKIRLTPEASQQVAGLTNLQVDVIIDTSPSPKSRDPK